MSEKGDRTPTVNQGGQRAQTAGSTVPQTTPHFHREARALPPFLKMRGPLAPLSIPTPSRETQLPEIQLTLNDAGFEKHQV